ncbi:hypothetical protein J6X90_02585 [Candidatus Saccharibacteria bacterium]|nr:hypothetical protein [Candidatus Saccharibacteria bacterium]
MKKGFTKQKYDSMMGMFTFFIPVSCVSFFLIMLIILAPESDTEIRMSLFLALTIAILIVLGISLITALILKTFGTKAYKHYAASVINLNPNDTIKIELLYSGIIVHYRNGRYIENVSLYFSDYGIKVRSREDIELPYFYMKDNIVYKLEFPFKESNENVIWSDFKLVERS